MDTSEFRIIGDADWLVNLPAERPGAAPRELEKIVHRMFRTRTGREIAVKTFLERNGR